MDYFATLGPACLKKETLERMFLAGMTGLRINLNHRPWTMCKDWLTLVDQASEGRPWKLLLDLKGRGLRLSPMTPLLISPDEILSLPVPKEIYAPAQPGDILLADDGKVRLLVLEKSPAALVCRVESGLQLEGGKNLCLEGKEEMLPPLSREDLETIAMLPGSPVWGLMLPFTHSRKDVAVLRESLPAGTEKLRLLAKIENEQGVEHLNEILTEADGIILARGDLGVHLPLEMLPRLQKNILTACSRKKVPCIVTTELLASMESRFSPTRAEVTDVYNAVLEGTEGLMLTNETARGAYPAQAMEWLVRIAREAKKDAGIQ